MKRHLRRAQWFFFVAGIILLAYVLYTLGRQSFLQRHESRRLDEARSRAAKTIPRPNPGEVLGRLEIPRIGLSVMVWEGESHEVLARGAGHLPDTALPGQRGNVAIAGHRDTVFRPLKDIRKDDVMTLTTPGGAYRYVVESTRIVKPTYTQVLDSTSYPVLTLVTCYPFYYIGSAPKRFVVRARQVGEPPAEVAAKR